MTKKLALYHHCSALFEKKVAPNFPYSSQKTDCFWHAFHFIRAMPILLDHPISSPTSVDVANFVSPNLFISRSMPQSARFWLDGSYVALGIKPLALTDSFSESEQYRDYFRNDVERLRTLASLSGLLFSVPPGSALYDPSHCARILRPLSSSTAITSPYAISVMIDSLEVETSARKKVFPAPLLGYPEGLPDILPSSRVYYLENQIFGHLDKFRTTVQGKFVCRISSPLIGRPHLLRLALASSLVLDIRGFPPDFVSASFVWSCDPKSRSLSPDRIKIEDAVVVDRRTGEWVVSSTF